LGNALSWLDTRGFGPSPQDGLAALERTSWIGSFGSRGGGGNFAQDSFGIFQQGFEDLGALDFGSRRKVDDSGCQKGSGLFQTVVGRFGRLDDGILGVGVGWVFQVVVIKCVLMILRQQRVVREKMPMPSTVLRVYSIYLGLVPHPLGGQQLEFSDGYLGRWS
jgi:hypothetical protein